MTSTRTRVLLGLVTVGVWIVVAILTAGTSKADQADFISQLDAQGIFYRDTAATINDGKIICGELRGHEPVGQIVTQAQTEGGFPGEKAAMFVMDAANALCPDVLPWLQAQANGASRPQRDYLS